MQFTWSPVKNKINYEKHGINFEDVVDIFFQPAVDREDEKRTHGEKRRLRFGYVQAEPVIVVYARRFNTIRIISARHAEHAEEEVLIGELVGESRRQQTVWAEHKLREKRKQERHMRIVSKNEQEER